MSGADQLVGRLQELEVREQQEPSSELSFDVETSLLAFSFRNYFEEHFAFELVFNGDLAQASEEEEKQILVSHDLLGNGVHFHDEHAVVALSDVFEFSPRLDYRFF